MESNSSTLSTGDQIVISVTDAPPPPPPPTLSASSRFHNTIPGLYGLYFVVLGYLIELYSVKMKFEHEKQSPFETHVALMIISLVTLSVALASGILMYTERFLHSAMTDIHFRILELISYFSGVLATISLFLVLSLPKNLNWVGYIVILVILLIIGECYFRGCIGLFLQIKYAEDREIHINHSISLMPLPIILMLFLPSNLNWIKFSVDGLTIVTVVVYNIFACIMKLVKKKNALNGKIIPLVA